MISNKEKKDCCGCGACEQACPYHAIYMVSDEKGFLYPQINPKLCRDCGICDQVCGFDENNPCLSSLDPKIYAAKHKTSGIRAQSTSGGAFTALSDEVLRQGGVIYGAAYDEKFNVKHIRVTDVMGRNCLRGSKYVQSNMGSCYQDVRQDLDEGYKVLFSGTPCQIASLRTFLKKEYENLIMVDIVCHGVPSNKIWQDYLYLIQQKIGHKVVAVNHREKAKTGWHHPQVKLEFDDSKPHNFHGIQSYFQLFNTNLCLRPSCLYCKFLSYARPSDISIADYWGIERFRKDFDDNKGTSMILLNTEKGIKLFEKIKTDLEYFQSDKEHCWQGRLQGRSTIPEGIDDFWNEYLNRGIKYVLIKYTDYSPVRLFVKKVKRRLRMMVGKD